MRAAATAVLVLTLALFLQACLGFGAGDCSREETPELSTTQEQITRNDVVAVLGEPIETFESEDGRVDVYEYDAHCGGVFFALGIFPIPLFFPKDQMLAVEYGPDDSFVTAEVWPFTETTEPVIAPYKRQAERQAQIEEQQAKLESFRITITQEKCISSLSQEIQFDEASKVDESLSCAELSESMLSEKICLGPDEQIALFRRCTTWKPDPTTLSLSCHLAKKGYTHAQARLAYFYRHALSPFGHDPVRAYALYRLAGYSGSKAESASQLTAAQIVRAEQLMALWPFHVAECEYETEQIGN
jgi:hypothetical protein